MKRLAVGLLVILCAMLVGAPPRDAAAAVPVEQRCNNHVAGDLEAQVRDLERRPPRNDADLDGGFAQLQSLIVQLGREDNVLEATCGNSKELDPLLAGIRAGQARAYVAQADLTLRKFAKCPTTRGQVAAGYLAAAWLSLARATPDTGAVPQPVQDVVPEVKVRAATVGLPLPTVADTSNYWMTTVQAAGKQAADACQQ